MNTTTYGRLDPHFIVTVVVLLMLLFMAGAFNFYKVPLDPMILGALLLALKTSGLGQSQVTVGNANGSTTTATAGAGSTSVDESETPPAGQTAAHVVSKVPIAGRIITGLVLAVVVLFLLMRPAHAQVVNNSYIVVPVTVSATPVSLAPLKTIANLKKLEAGLWNVWSSVPANSPVGVTISIEDVVAACPTVRPLTAAEADMYLSQKQTQSKAQLVLDLFRDGMLVGAAFYSPWMLVLKDPLDKADSIIANRVPDETRLRSIIATDSITMLPGGKAHFSFLASLMHNIQDCRATIAVTVSAPAGMAPASVVPQTMFIPQGMVPERQPSPVPQLQQRLIPPGGRDEGTESHDTDDKQPKLKRNALAWLSSSDLCACTLPVK